MRQIARDPFARSTTYRRTMIVSDAITCGWCGQHRPGNRLYQYGVEQDGIRTRVEWDRPFGGNRPDVYFCSKSCRTSYYL
jgi:hypothetical protein